MPFAGTARAMKIKNLLSTRRHLRRLTQAFSLVEVTMSMGVIGVSVAALFSGFTSGFFTMQMARENLRATQIMLERVETIRLYSWDQINTPGYITPAFSASYDPEAPSGQNGLVYRGTISVEDCGVPAS